MVGVFTIGWSGKSPFFRASSRNAVTPSAPPTCRSASITMSHCMAVPVLHRASLPTNPGFDPDQWSRLAYSNCRYLLAPASQERCGCRNQPVEVPHSDYYLMTSINTSLAMRPDQDGSSDLHGGGRPLKRLWYFRSHLRYAPLTFAGYWLAF